MLNFIMLIFYLSTAWSGSVIQVGCKVFDENGVMIKKFPGHMCVFRDNGERVVSSFGELAYIDSQDNPVWSKKKYLHHQIKVDETNNQIIGLSEIYHDILGVKTRFDTISIFDIKTGKVKKVIDFYDYFKKQILKIERDYVVLSKVMLVVLDSFKYDTTHVNSIAQIPANPSSQLNAAFEEGNWIVNLSFSGAVIIFDRNFQNILWQKTLHLTNTGFHDVQVTPEGKILIYLNDYLKSGSLDEPVTAVAEVDPFEIDDNKIKVFELKDNGKNFIQHVTGGIQILPGGMKLASVFDFKNGFQVGVLDKNWNVVRKFIPIPSVNDNVGQNFQESRMLDLSQFFKNFKG